MKPYPIILAAGQGTRMRSNLPKVLHPVGGKAMLQHVIDACRELHGDRMAVIYGHGGDQVKAAIPDTHIQWVEQAEQKGTGHAVAQAAGHIQDDDDVVIAYGDVPLISASTLNALASALQNADLVVLTTQLSNPFGYGRIVRSAENNVQKIVEEKDADDEVRKIQEVNTGFIAAKGKQLKTWLQAITPNNAQGEYYLTDCVELAVAEGAVVDAVICENPMEVQGVNNRMQQAELERAYQWQQAQALMVDGVTMMDPKRVDIRGSMTVGKDVVIDVNNVFIGEVTLGDNVVIEPGCVIDNVVIGANTRVKANSVLESAAIGQDCDIGPFARLRPDTVLHDKAKVGNFVEIKNATIGSGSKVNHLSYVGDTTMGSSVNIGAGTITCNYDGANKHQTLIGNNVFVGSCTQMVAPVEIADGSTIGAGSTITKNTQAGSLTVARAKQVTIKDWVRPTKQ